MFSSPVAQVCLRPGGKRRHHDADARSDLLPTVKIPVRTMLYLECADHGEWTRAMDDLGTMIPRRFCTTAPSSLHNGVRVVEVALTRTVTVALANGAVPPTSAALEAQSLVGWLESNGEGVYLLHDDLLRLVDDDKRPGLSQVLISDMFTTLSLGGRGRGAR